VVAAIRRNLGLKMLAFALAVVAWAYFRFASNPFLPPGFEQEFTVPIAAVNLPARYVAELPQNVAIVTGQAERGHPAVKAAQLKAVVDLSNRTPGVYNVPVQLIAPSDFVEASPLSPSSVTLSIEKIDRRLVPVAMHYTGRPNAVVEEFTVAPAAVTVDGPTTLLSHVATVRVDLPLDSSQSGFDAMVRPIAVDSNGNAIGGVQVAPNLVRVQAKFARPSRN
jgi:YbbR domain-containing protein